MSGRQQKRKVAQRGKPLSQKEPRTGLLSLLAVAGAIVGFAWWRRQQQPKAQKPKGTQESRSPFRFPNAKAGTSSRGRQTQNNKKKKGKERREEVKARQNPAKGEGRDAKDSKEDKDKDPLVLNYSYFVPDRSDRLGTPAQRMTLPSKQGETQS
ncbi:hypothetical protein COCOBI_02-2110 [Coccomyxa sp. Obi]|nr:hypothetical protein COCOBI_02-2110 [Coccomyxa sp. Obi]